MMLAASPDAGRERSSGDRRARAVTAAARRLPSSARAALNARRPPAASRQLLAKPRTTMEKAGHNTSAIPPPFAIRPTDRETMAAWGMKIRAATTCRSAASRGETEFRARRATGSREPFRTALSGVGKACDIFASLAVDQAPCAAKPDRQVFNLLIYLTM